MSNEDAVTAASPLAKGKGGTETNRKIGGDAPSVYLQRVQSEKQVGLSDAEMDEVLSSHALNPEFLRNDDYEAFRADRRVRLSQLISSAMGKPVSTIPEHGEYLHDDAEESLE